MKFGTGVTCMPNHDPFMIAHRIAQLDHMAKGRFMWGVGSGGFPGDFEVFGFDPKTGDHRTMTREAIETVLQLWDDPKPGRYKSKYWDFNVPEPDDLIGLRVHLKPYQKPHPPIGVAGVSENSGTLTLAGARGWIPMSINLVPTRVIKTHWDSVEEGALAAGRQPDRSLWRIAREVYVAETTEIARKEALEGTLARDFRDYFLHVMPKVRMLDSMKIDPDMPDSDVTVEYSGRQRLHCGEPRRCHGEAAAAARRRGRVRRAAGHGARVETARPVGAVDVSARERGDAEVERGGVAPTGCSALKFLLPPREIHPTCGRRACGRSGVYERHPIA